MLEPGTIAQYRKVGKVQIVAHDCPDGYWDASCKTEATQHRYIVTFLTGPRKLREAGELRGYWLRDSEKIGA